MDNIKINCMIETLLKELEEEDVGMSLLTLHYQNQEELDFFSPEDQEKIMAMLIDLADDSKKHKELLKKMIQLLEAKKDAN